MAARLLAHTLLKRQSGDQTLGGTGVYDDVDADTFSNNDEYDDHNSWWWSPVSRETNTALQEAEPMLTHLLLRRAWQCATP